MPQNNIVASLRRMAWRIIPAPVLNGLFGARLRGMGQMIDAAQVVRAWPVQDARLSEPCYGLELRDGTVLISTTPSPNNIKITHSVRQKLKLGPEYSKALVDLVLRYRFPHALVPVLRIPVPDAQRGGFHLQHRKLPQETNDFTQAEKQFLLTHFTPQPGWHILDIGCYLGHGATHLGQLVGPQGKIIAVEAIPSNAKIAEFQIRSNQLAQVTIFNRAIWRESGATVAMNVTENQANAIAENVITSTKKIDLTTTSIKELTQMLGKPADLVSLTVNGAEVEALDSLDAMPKDQRPQRMVMPGWYPADDQPRSTILQEKLKSLGYQTLLTQHKFVIAWRGEL